MTEDKMRYSNPGATVDLIVEREEKILLVKRKGVPFQNMWALPGGFLEYGKESLEQAAIRELKEETGLIASKLELFSVYSDPNRDPRGHTISHVYLATTFGESKAGDDAKETRWFSFYNLPELAFDHNKIVKEYLDYKNHEK